MLYHPINLFEEVLLGGVLYKLEYYNILYPGIRNEGRIAAS